MKKLLIFTLMMFVWVGFSSAKKDAPEIVFSTLIHDFGTIRESKGPVSFEFKFTNKGTAPLVIVSATAGCGCTKPSFDGEPIRPGDSSSIKVTYLPKGRPGEFNKNVTVRTNDPAHKKVSLRISGTVVP